MECTGDAGLVDEGGNAGCVGPWDGERSLGLRRNKVGETGDPDREIGTTGNGMSYMYTGASAFNPFDTQG